MTIYAETPEQANNEAKNRPNVLSVQPGMTIPGDKLAAEPYQGLEDE